MTPHHCTKKNLQPKKAEGKVLQPPPRHTLEKTLRSPTRGVRVRRKIYGKDARLRRAMEKLPYRHFDYEKVGGFIYTYFYFIFFKLI